MGARDLERERVIVEQIGRRCSWQRGLMPRELLWKGIRGAGLAEAGACVPEPVPRQSNRLLLIDPSLPRVFALTMLVSKGGEVILERLTLAILILQITSLKEVSIRTGKRPAIPFVQCGAGNGPAFPGVGLDLYLHGG